MKLSAFGYTLEIKLTSSKPEYVVVKLLEQELLRVQGSNVSKKIALIKIMRKEEVSKILIDAHLVPDSEIGGDMGHHYVGLCWAKEWVEAHFPEL